MKGQGITLVATAMLIFGSASPARANLFLTGSTTVHDSERETALSFHEGNETIIERIAIRGDVESFVWLRAFPNAPKVAALDPEGLEALKTQTQVSRPYNDVLRDGPFGPSLITVLTRRLEDTPTSEKPAPRRTDVTLEPPSFFSGLVTTSTIDFSLMLPNDLDTFLSANGVELDRPTKSELARYLNKKWVLVAQVGKRNGPEADLSVLPTNRYEFVNKAPIYPGLGNPNPRSLDWHLYTYGSAPLVPHHFERVWNDKPWEPVADRNERFEIIFSAAVDRELMSDELWLDDALKLALPPEAWLIAGRYVGRLNSIDDVVFSEEPERIEIPGSSRRGSLWDLLLCALLGLTPLIYTPESWFFLWMGARARDGVRAGQERIGHRLWPLFTVAVGVYWFIVLPGAGRVAGVIPVVLGIIQLVWPSPEPGPRPVRAAFAKRKK